MPKKKRSIRKPVKNLAPKECFFCKEKKEPTFADSQMLSRFTTERAKIIPSLRSGLCSKHQSKTAVEIKRARHLALLPFVVKI